MAGQSDKDVKYYTLEEMSVSHGLHCSRDCFLSSLGLLQGTYGGGNGSSGSDFLCELPTLGNIGRKDQGYFVIVCLFVCLIFVFLAYTYSDMVLRPYPGPQGQE